jgi:hypothetical protein
MTACKVMALCENGRNSTRGWRGRSYVKRLTNHAKRRIVKLALARDIENVETHYQRKTKGWVW